MLCVLLVNKHCVYMDEVLTKTENFLLENYLSNSENSIDIIGDGWITLCINFLKKALEVDPATLVLSVCKENYFLTVKFTNYSEYHTSQMLLLENQIKILSSEICEFTGKFGVPMSNGTTQRILNPLVAPLSYNVVLGDTSNGKNNYLLIVKELLEVNRELTLSK